MRHVRWIFVAVLLFSLTAFIDKDKPTTGLSVGNKAPDFSIEEHNMRACLKALKGNYVLLSFWASYDASARVNNMLLDHVLNDLPRNVKMVSVSFDRYQSIFDETLKQDRLGNARYFVEPDGEASNLFSLYHLDKGFKNYLLDEHGVIIAMNVRVEQLPNYLHNK